MNRHELNEAAKPLMERLKAVEPQVKPAGLPPMDNELREILGRPNFACAGIAQRLRMVGQEIAFRAEDEQAAVIYWMVNLYLKHGEKWRDEAKKELAVVVQPASNGICGVCGGKDLRGIRDSKRGVIAYACQCGHSWECSV